MATSNVKPKRAKRVTRAAAKKPVSKKTVTTVRPKKKSPITKKTVTNAKKLTPKNVRANKKTPVKKTTPQKSPVKRVSKQPAAKKPKDTTVRLPKRMSMRAQEKALVLSEMFDRDFYKSALTLSRVVGVSFIVVGAFLSLSTLQQITDISCGTGCVAQLPSANAVALDPDSLISASTPQLLATLPETLSSDVFFSLQVANAAEVAASLQFIDNDGNGGLILLTTAKLPNDKYDVEIRGSVLEPGQYSLIIEVKPLVGTTNYQTYTVGKFTVPQNTPELQPEPTDSPEASRLLEIAPIAIQSDQEIRAQEQAAAAIPPVTLSAPASASGPITINVNSQTSLGVVVFFVRSTSGVNPQQIGTISQGATTFRFNTESVPNATYELFARVNLDDKVVTTPAIRMVIFNESRIPESQRRANQERELLQISQQLNEDLYSSFEPGENIDEAILRISKDRLLQDQETLDKLFTALAAAKQSGDASLIVAASNAIDEYREAIISEAIRDEEDRFIADELDATLEQKLATISNRVDQFEQVRRDRTENDSSIDSDEDGISDLDEQVIYKTDPNNPDTDGDGFTDGIEIVRGFDPLDATPEAVVSFESPKETFGVTQAEKLIVSEVTPNVVLETESATEQVQTVVRGQALPNSFVTLYIFSTPTIVTVRTDASGAFEYTFTKELEDGEHQVFAALTDNTGQIIAQSQPFTFIKQARAFTPVDAEADAAGVQPDFAVDTSTDNTASYRIAIGMAVLALGILLILLGVGLRANKPERHIVAEA